MAASHIAVAELLLAAARPNETQRKVLARFARQPIKNVRGLLVGEMHGSEDFPRLSSPHSR
jgi:proline dehydrogenase